MDGGRAGKEEERGAFGAFVWGETRLCVCEYVYQKCVWTSYRTETQREEEKTLKRQFRDGVWGSSRGYVTVGWMYGERNVLENERLYRARYFLFCLKWQKSELFSSFKTSLPTKMMNHLNPGEAVPLKRFKGHHHTLHRSRVSVSLCLQGFTHTHTDWWNTDCTKGKTILTCFIFCMD